MKVNLQEKLNCDQHIENRSQFLTHSYVLEDLPEHPGELCQNDAMAVKHLLMSCVEHNNIRLRCFSDSIQNKLKDCLGENKINCNTIKFLKK